MEIEVAIGSDADGEPIFEPETIKAGVAYQGDIIAENGDGSVDIQFGDGSVANAIPVCLVEEADVINE